MRWTTRACTASGPITKFEIAYRVYVHICKSIFHLLLTYYAALVSTSGTVSVVLVGDSDPTGSGIDGLIDPRTAVVEDVEEGVDFDSGSVLPPSVA